MKVVNVQIKIVVMKIIVFTLIISNFFASSIVFSGKIEKVLNSSDTLYFKLPRKIDTANIKYLDSNLKSVVIDKWHEKNFKAPGAMSFDFFRSYNLKFHHKEIPKAINGKFIGIAELSDSLQSAGRAFFKRHFFYVVIDRNDSSFFYPARGNYMYKNYENDVKDDCAGRRQ
jgi:hypothetical protein